MEKSLEIKLERWRWNGVGAAIMQSPVRAFTFTLSKVGAICRFGADEWHGLIYMSKGCFCLCVENRWGWGGERAGRSREIHWIHYCNPDERREILDRRIVVAVMTCVWVLWWLTEWGRQKAAEGDSKVFAEQLVERSGLYVRWRRPWEEQMCSAKKQ